MRIKKMLALLLALAMCLALVACGGGNASSGGAASGGNASSGGAVSSDGGAAAPVGDPVNLVLASSYKESDAEGQYLQYFMDYCTEKSGGTITFTTYMAGSLGTAAEEVGMLQNGDVDVIAFYAPAYAFEMTEFTCILNAVGSIQDAVDFFHEICYNNETTAPLFAASAGKYNMTLLGGIFAVGRTVFPCTREVKSWDDLRANFKLGAISSYPEMEGYNSYLVIDPTSYYESLRTGLCDAVETSVDSVMTGKLYEVAPHMIATSIYSPFNHMAMNTDSFNALSAEQQQIVKDAALAAEAYSMEVCDAAFEDLIAACEAEGGSMIEMTEAELAEYWDLQFQANYSSILAGLAVAAGAEEQAEVIIGEILEYWETGYTTDDIRAFATGG